MEYEMRVAEGLVLVNDVFVRRLTLDRLPLPLLVWDTERNLIYANRKAAEVTITTGINFPRLRAVLDREKPLTQAAAGVIPEQGTVELPVPGTTGLSFLHDATPVINLAGEVVAVVSVLVPRELAAVPGHGPGAALTQQAAGRVAHQVRNPLATVAGFLELIATRAQDPKIQEFAGIALSEVNRAVHVTALLTDFFQPVLLECRPHDPDEIVRSVVASLRPQADARQVRFSMNWGTPARPHVICDGDKVRQAVQHVVSNALEATAPGGKVDLLLSATAREIIVSVRDTGPGVPEELTDLIFEPFFTTRAGAMGLGLALSRRIMEAHGGSISVAGRAGSEDGGAIFRLTLPLTPG